MTGLRKASFARVSYHRTCVVLSLICLVLVSGMASAQEIIELDEPTTVSFDGDAPALVIYDAEAGEIVNIVVDGVDDFLDTVMAVIDPDGNQLVFNDDTWIPDGDSNINIQYDAQVLSLRLDQAGEHLIYVDSFNGVEAGEAVVTVFHDDFFAEAQTQFDEPFALDAFLDASAVITYTLDLEAGDRITITARDLTGNLDPVASLLYDGEVIAENDDHTDIDLELNTLDAKLLDVGILESGNYQIEVIDFLGNAGWLQVTIAVEKG